MEYKATEAYYQAYIISRAEKSREQQSKGEAARAKVEHTAIYKKVGGRE